MIYKIDWKAEIEDYRSSGKTIPAFCKDKEYCQGTFEYHLYKKDKDNTSLFLPVIVTTDPCNDIMVNGYILRVEQNTSDETLRKVLKAIGELS